MPRHYLDHASTTPLRPEAARAMADWLAMPVADPGRLHHEAHVVRAAVEDARDQVAALFRVRPRQVVFTSGGTEAIATVVWSATQARPGAVCCAPVEHSAVREASERLASVVELPVDHCGRIGVDGVAEALAQPAGSTPPALVHCQWANHEVGTCQPVAEVVAISREASVPVHVDAGAACGHVCMDLDQLGADAVSVSAHMMGGPPGIGALVLRRGVRLSPLLVGGEQERGRRAGMENVPGIVGFGAAAGALTVSGVLDEEVTGARRYIGQLTEAATSITGVHVVGDPDPSGRLPHLVCLGVDGVEAEPVLLGLDQAGIAAHSGSACASESLEPSPVLAAMGEDPSHSLRLSVGWSTTDEDVAAFGAAFGDIVGRLRALRGHAS